MSDLTVTVNHVLAPGGALVSTREVVAGTPLIDTKPQGRGRMICRVNGGPGYISQKLWPERIPPGAIVEWLDYPEDGDDGGPGFLQVAIAFVAAIATDNPYPLLALFATNAANFFLEKPNQPAELKEASPTYATGISGNQARLYNVVPKICGRHQTYPPLASQPYSEYDESGEQFLYVLLALGIGSHEIERVLIDDTDINHFSDVLTCTYLPPGTEPFVVRSNVINSPEVANQDMLTGEYIGGFSACGPRALTNDIAIDVIAPQGIGIQDSSGNVGALEVRWRVEIRSLNEFGTAISPWAILANEARTAASREPQRWSARYALDTPIRPEIRIVRTDVKSTNARELNDLVWSGMRAYLESDSPLNPNVAHFEIVMRASKQLNGVSQNRISVIATGMCRDLNEDLTFGDEIATRNGALWLADLWTSAVWGEGLDADAVDLRTLYALKVLWDQRQDRFDYIFDTAIDADSASQLIAEAGRARTFRRGGVRTLARDQLITAPRTAFTTRNTLPGSMVANEETPRLNLPDGVIMEYFDNRSWNYGQPIECPCPGVLDMQRPIRMRKAGITGRTHANREGLYEAAKIALRRRTVQATTEMQGSLPAFGSAVRWQSELTRWQSGDVVSWDQDTQTMRLTEPPVWGAAPSYIVLIRNDGSLTNPIQVFSGSFATEVILAEGPDFLMSTEDGTRERTTYLLGGLADDELLVKITSIADGGKQGGAQFHKISAFVDDERIHQADNALLPSPGEIQDPIDTTEGEPGGGTTPIVNITNQDLSSVDSGLSSIVFRADGSMHVVSGGNFTVGTSFRNEDVPQQWLFAQPIDVSVSSQFELRATLISGNGIFTIEEPQDVWLNLGTSRMWQAEPIAPGFPSGALMRFEIRDVATETIQDTALVDLNTLVL